ncbi:MAG: hypothetical protein VKJ24_22110, partial [Synechococcales bacterium]|nr:hypothetical protein [Synechococcales bacterium]
MTSCKGSSRPLPLHQPLPRLQLTTLVLLELGLGVVLLLILWIAGIPPMPQLFDQLDQIQQHPPLWLQVPMGSESYLWIYPVVLFVSAWLI